MPWFCPDCNKKFLNKNQWHSCATLDLSEHLKAKPPKIKNIVELLLQEVNKFGEITINPVKTSIQVKTSATFLSIKVKSSCVEIEFQMGYEADEFPVYKTVRISGNRVLHFVIIEQPEEIDTQIISWLRDSYELIKTK